MEYSLDKGQSWTVVDGGAVEITSTNLTQLYKDVKLPAELSGQNFALRVKSWDNKCERRYSCTDRSKQY